VQDVINSIDKNKNEVVLDIEIYEVSHDSLLQIGNQIATTPGQFLSTEKIGERKDTGEPIFGPPKNVASLGALGGFGTKSLLPAGVGSAGVLSAFNLTGAGFLLGLPPTSLSLLQSKGNSKLLHKTQIHVLDGGQNKTKVGRSVPVKLGTQNFGGGLGGVIGNPGQTNPGGTQALQSLLGGFGNQGFDSIQYRDVGLVIDAQPTITNEGYVEIKMNFETSDVVASGADDRLTPVFTQRSLNTVARIQDGVTSVVAGVNQESKGDSRAGIPVLGMLPIVGRLFTTPRQESRQSDVIITVTPHIVRSAGITQKDHLALIGPPQQGSLNQSIEDVVNRAQVEEDEERRLIAGKTSPGVPLDAPVGAPTQQQANFGNPPRPVAGSQPVQNVNFQNPNNRKVIREIGTPSKGSGNPAANVPPIP
ncbi:MAG: type II secretion system protein GspD, partial [Blastocatellia bacterium]